MTSYALTTAQVSAVIVGLSFIVLIRLIEPKKKSTHPPEVPSLLPWIGSAFSFAAGPSGFLVRCHAQFGPVFKFLLGGRNVIVVGSAEAIHSAVFTDHRVLSNRDEHYSLFVAICKDTSLYPMMYDTVIHKLFPVLSRRLSRTTVDDFTAGFAETVFQRLKPFSGGERVSLMRTLREPVYVAATAIFLGSKFSPDTYEDCVTYFDSVPKRLMRRPFWSMPSTLARERLLQHITTCLQGANPDNIDDKLAGHFSKVIRESNIPFNVASPAFLSVILALHRNVFNSMFWLLSWLMADPEAYSFLRDAIDKAVREEFGNLQTFIAKASPQKLDSPAFALLGSAIREATRLAVIQNGIRLAECDLQLKDGARTIPVRKNDYVLLYPPPAQRDETFYPEAHKFVLDRFVNCSSESPTGGKPYFAFGAGKNICKGRYLAMYEMKVLTILYLTLFDVTPVPFESRSSTWKPPQCSAESIGTLQPANDVFVKLRPRATF